MADDHSSIEQTERIPQDEFGKWKDKLPEILKPMFGDKLPDKLSDEQYDEFIFSRARLITAAEKAKIHTVDWTPVALNNPTMTTAMEGNYGLEKIGWREHIPNHEVGGIWGHKTHQAGVPYAMEEDFVQSYQEMHGLVPDEMKLYDHKTGKEIGDVPVGATLNGNSRKVIDAAGFDNVLYSLAIDNAGQITTGNHPNFTRDLNIRGNYIDMAAVDILRGREKQLPRYNEYLRQMHEKPIESFEELVPGNTELREQIRKVYNNDIEKVDTVIGTLAEWPHRTPKTMGFSASTFLEFILMASRRVQAKIDAMFNGKDSISKDDIDNYLDARGVGFLDKIFIKGQFDSGFKSVRKDSISKEEFIKIMNGELMQQRIAEQEAKKHK